MVSPINRSPRHRDALEYLNIAPDPAGYERLWQALLGQRWIDVTAAAMSRALDVHRSLAMRSQHRGSSLPDLIIAATAELGGLTVLHYHADYERIAAITGQPTEGLPLVEASDARR